MALWKKKKKIHFLLVLRSVRNWPRALTYSSWHYHPITLSPASSCSRICRSPRLLSQQTVLVVLRGGKSTFLTRPAFSLARKVSLSLQVQFSATSEHHLASKSPLVLLEKDNYHQDHTADVAGSLATEMDTCIERSAINFLKKILPLLLPGLALKLALCKKSERILWVSFKWRFLQHLSMCSNNP